MKQLRQRAIRDLVDQRPIRTQQELAAALREHGFRTTQATISRDVAELGLIKVTREGTAAYALPPRLIEAESSGEDRLRKLLSDLPLEIHDAGLLLVLRTLPGSAHAIAAALDRARWPEVAGSIAGDDTLFVAFPDRGSLQRIKRRLIRLTEGGRAAEPQAAGPRGVPPVPTRAAGAASIPPTAEPALGAFDTHPPHDYHSRPVGTSGARLAADRLEFFPLSMTAQHGPPKIDPPATRGPPP